MEKSRKILITHSLSSYPNLAKWCGQHSVDITALSFIKIKPILGLEIPKTDWIFFSSPKGAAVYLENYTISAKKIGVYGKGTNSMLEKYGLFVDFIGDINDSPQQIGQKFNLQVDNEETVFFPLSNFSKKTILQEVDSNKYIDLIVYETILKTRIMNDNYDLIFFTSPSNFESFMQSNRITENTIVLAIGNTTGDSIKKELANQSIHILETPTEKSLIDFLNR